MNENLRFIGHYFKTGSGCPVLKKEHKPACLWYTEYSSWVKSVVEKWVYGLYGHRLHHNFLGIKNISEQCKSLNFSEPYGKHCLNYKRIIERILPELKYNFL